MAKVPYDPVPSVENSGNLGGGMGVSASPADFGAQVGAATEDAGNKAFELAQKQQGMLNETMMTNADADFATKVGKIKGDYTALTGMAAYSAFPQYQQNIKDAFQESRATLPAGAQRGFDMMATRTMANHVADGSSYASSQLKEAQRDSYSNLANAQVQSLLDPATASDPARAQTHLDSLKFAAEAQVDPDHPGLQTDPKTGSVSFDESTPVGQQGKADLQRQQDTYLSQGYVAQYSALAKLNVPDAFNKYQENRDQMPRPAQVALDAYFAPKIFDAHTNTATGNTVASAQQDHYQMLTNPSSTGSNSNNLGNVKTAQGAAQGTADFVNPATPVDGVVLTANTLRKGYQGMTIAQIGNKWAPSSENKTSDWVANVSKASGLSPDTVPNLNDPQQLSAVLKGIATAEKSPADRAKFTDDVVAQGVQASLAGKQPATSAAKTYATNENGGPLSIADYYRTHSQDVLAKGDAYAETQIPGDLALKRAVRQSLQNQMTQTIANESAQHMMDNRNVVKAINGEFTKGTPPANEQELRAIPGMGNLLDNVAARDPKFSETIPTLIGKVAQRNNVTNSPNGYDTVLRTLEPHGSANPNAIASEDHLVSELTKPDGAGINMKDFNDAKPAIELDQTLKDNIRKNMQQIANANGNLDGKGQERAMAWYNQTMAAWKQNQAAGDKALAPLDFVNPDKGMLPVIPAPSRMQQINTAAAAKTAFAVVTTKEQRNALPSGSVYVRDGKQYTKQ